MFFSSLKSGKVNCVFISTIVRSMFEEKYNSAVKLLLQLKAAFVGLTSGYFDEPKLTSFHTLFQDLDNYPIIKLRIAIESSMPQLQFDNIHSKTWSKYENNIWKFGGHVLHNYGVSYVRAWYGKRKNLVKLNYLYASYQRHFNFAIKIP